MKFIIQYYIYILTHTDYQAGFIKLTKKALVSYLITSTAIVGSGLEAAWPALSEIEGFNDNWGYRKAYE